jgi:hypothetical protein
MTTGVTGDQIGPGNTNNVPYWTNNGNDGIPTLGITLAGGPALSNAALVLQDQYAGIANDQLSAYNQTMALGQPFGWYVGLLIFVLALFWLNHSKWAQKSPGAIRGSLANVLIIGISAVLFIAGSKVLLTRYPVKGLSTLVGGV